MATPYKCEALLSGKLIMAADFAHGSEKTHVWLMFHPSYFAEGLLSKVILTPGYVSCGSKKLSFLFKAILSSLFQ